MGIPSPYSLRHSHQLPIGLLVVACLVIAVTVQPLLAQEVGDTVRLESANPQGVPVHPAAGDRSFVR